MSSEPSASSTLVDQIVVPGDIVLDLSQMPNQTIKLGGGLRQECDAVTVMKRGKLRYSKPNKYWVETSHKRYVPCAEDYILGVVVDAKAENFLVDIKGPTIAFLPVLAFEGGTRRNIPKFQPSTLIYARVVKANPGMNPELSCTDALEELGKKLSFEIAIGFNGRVELGKKLSFEIAIGFNGKVWVNATSPSIIIVVYNAIMNSEHLSGVQQKIMVEKLLQRIQD